jgi:hypothetical protein
MQTVVYGVWIKLINKTILQCNVVGGSELLLQTKVVTDFPINLMLLFQAVSFDQGKRCVDGYRILQKI